MPDPALAAGAELHGEASSSHDEIPLSELLRELAADGRRLVRDEIGLAKLELGQSARAAAAVGALVGAGVVIGAFGAACLVAALVIGIGGLVGSYWASALGVGVLLSVVGGLALVIGLERVRSTRIAPEKTIETLRDDVDWASDEVRALRRDWSRS